MKRIDLTGKQFNRWFVVGYAGTHNGIAFWLCACDCGFNVRPVNGKSLRSGDTTSCGCYSKEIHTKHALTQSSTYQSWSCMIQRCTNPSRESWDYYGGKGIYIEPRWYNFQEFLSDMGERIEGTTLDRIDSNGPYAPWNCRWSTCSVQSHNRTSRSNSSSQFKGICWDSKSNKWLARITKNGKVERIGLFDDECCAALAYDARARELYGAEARLNCP